MEEQEQLDREEGRMFISQQQEKEALQVARRDHKVHMRAYREERGPSVKRIRTEPSSTTSTPSTGHTLNTREEPIQLEEETSQEGKGTTEHTEPTKRLIPYSRRTLRGGRRLRGQGGAHQDGPSDLTSPYRGVGGPQPAPSARQTHIMNFFHNLTVKDEEGKDDGKESRDGKDTQEGKEEKDVRTRQTYIMNFFHKLTEKEDEEKENGNEAEDGKETQEEVEKKVVRNMDMEENRKKGC